MPWSETCAMDERMRFAVAASAGEAVMSEICAAFGITRQTGCKWLARYRFPSPAPVKERSPAPLSHGGWRAGVWAGRHEGQARLASEVAGAASGGPVGVGPDRGLPSAWPGGGGGSRPLG